MRMDDFIGKMATQRVLEGCRKYGVIHLKTDTRCFRKEALEELLDAKNYLQWGCEKNQIPQGNFQNLDKSIHLMVRMLIYHRRIAIAEPVFANIRVRKVMNRFTLRGKTKVNIQWLL